MGSSLISAERELKMPIRTLLIEHDGVSRDVLLGVLAGDSGFELVGFADNGDAAVNAILQHRPELAIIDVDVPILSGLEVLERVRPFFLPTVILTSAQTENAARAFDIEAADYLPKPIRDGRVKIALERARDRILRKAADIARVPEEASETQTAQKLAVHTGRKIVMVPREKIEWIEAAGNNIKIQCGKDQYVTRLKISDIEAKLGGGQFVRIHRSYIANVDMVAEVQPCGRGEFIIVMSSGKELPLSKTYREQFEEAIENS
jgi:two-component system LytT family response regulator